MNLLFLRIYVLFKNAICESKSVVGAPHGVRSVQFAPYQIFSPTAFFRQAEQKIYLSSFKNIFQKVYIEANIYLFREV